VVQEPNVPAAEDQTYRPTHHVRRAAAHVLVAQQPETAADRGEALWRQLEEPAEGLLVTEGFRLASTTMLDADVDFGIEATGVLVTGERTLGQVSHPEQFFGRVTLRFGVASTGSFQLIVHEL
jgi:hypothetical protein